jgi:hypothetical protein
VPDASASASVTTLEYSSLAVVGEKLFGRLGELGQEPTAGQWDVDGAASETERDPLHAV